mgnify:CR=1 FL=1
MAINFPDTAGQATDGTFTYTVAGITYAWNGSSWAAAGAGASATNRSLFSVTTNSASGGGSLSYDTSSGGFTYTPPDLSGYLTTEADTLADVVARGSTTGGSITFGELQRVYLYTTNTSIYGNSNGINVQAAGNNDIRLKSNDSGGSGGDVILNTTSGGYLIAKGTDGIELHHNGTTDKKFETTSTGVTVTGALTAGGLTYPTTNGTSGQVLTSNGAGSVTWTNGGLQSRTTSASGLNTLANSASATPNITTPKTYALLGIETTHAAWVVLYNSDAARTADQSRGINVDPVAGSGVLAEVITTGAQTQYLSPGVICYNTQTTGTTYARVTNLSGSTASVNVTLTYVQLEA